jgi:S1-C subfamily serine protease
MKNIFVLVLLALPLLPGPPAPAEQPSGDRSVHQRLLRSTGLVIGSGKEPGMIGIGTCWVIDLRRRLVVTNYHVVAGQTRHVVYFPAYREGKLVRDFAYYQARRGIPGRVLVKNRSLDLAIIELARVPRGVLALPLAQGPARVGQMVYALGNSQRRKGVIWWFRRERVRGVRFVTARMNNGQVVRAHVVLSTPNARPGDSGGPVVDASGRLVSVTSSVGKDSQSIQAREVRVFFRRLLARQSRAAGPARRWAGGLSWAPAGRPELSGPAPGFGVCLWEGTDPACGPRPRPPRVCFSSCPAGDGSFAGDP